MITSAISQVGHYPQISQFILRAMSIVSATPEPGEIDIEGRDFYLNIVSGSGRVIDGSSAEIHRDYADIHIVLNGTEKIGYLPEPADPQFMMGQAFNSDCELRNTLVNEQFITLHAQQFIVFFPGEWHRPMLCVDSPEPIEKVIIKVHKTLL